MQVNNRFKFVLFAFGFLLIVSIGPQSVFAEKVFSIQKTVDVNKDSLISSFFSLDKYSQIFPDRIKSSHFIGDNTANMKIGLDWLTTSADVTIVESDDKVTLEIISGDFKGTKLYVTMSEKDSTNDTLGEKTDVLVEMHLQMSWYLGLFAPFVSDDDMESMLYSSLVKITEYTKNPQIPEKIVEEKEKFCIFGFCF